MRGSRPNHKIAGILDTSTPVKNDPLLTGTALENSDNEVNTQFADCRSVQKREHKATGTALENSDNEVNTQFADCRSVQQGYIRQSANK